MSCLSSLIKAMSKFCQTQEMSSMGPLCTRRPRPSSVARNAISFIFDHGLDPRWQGAHRRADDACRKLERHTAQPCLVCCDGLGSVSTGTACKSAFLGTNHPALRTRMPNHRGVFAHAFRYMALSWKTPRAWGWLFCCQLLDHLPQ